MEFVKYFKPFYYMTKVFGLAPYKIKNETVIDTTMLSNVSSLIWSIVLTATVLYFSIVSLVCEERYSIFEELDAVNKISALVHCGITATYLLLTNFVYRNKFKELFDNILNSDILLFSDVIIYQIAFFVIFVIIFSIDGIIWAIIESQRFHYEIGKRLITILNNATYLFYCNIVYVIWHRLKEINNNISRILNHIEINGINIFVPTTLSPVENIHSSSIIQQNDRSSNVLLMRHVYSAIKKLSKNVNSMFGLYILFESTYNFMAFVSHIYIGILNCYGKNIECKWLIYHLFAWILFYLIKQGTVCFLCNLSCSQTQELQENMQNILIHLKKSDLHRQVKLFSTQISRNEIVFSACGFYKLNLNLFYSYIASAVSFLIILIQFRN
ncbi:hypothetical protein L9F63_001336, partial [Diploptera punctata]